jgi:uncharacterized protein (TIGR00369 family)
MGGHDTVVIDCRAGAGQRSGTESSTQPNQPTGSRLEKWRSAVTVVPNPDCDPFLTRWNDFYSRVEDVTATLGLVPVSGNEHEVTLRMPLRREISQPAGMFSAASLYGLADISGTFLAMAQAVGAGFPLAVQSSINLVRNTAHGHATAKSTLVSAGRTLIVTDTRVVDDTERLLAAVVTTYVTPR